MVSSGENGEWCSKKIKVTHITVERLAVVRRLLCLLLRGGEL